MPNVAFVQAKGGVAKTTTAVLLSLALARQDARVAFCDLDPNAGASKWLKDHPHENIELRSVAGQPLDDGQAVQIIDTQGRSVVHEVISVLPDIDLFIVPCGPSVMEVEGAATTVQAIRHWNPNAVIRVIWNRLGAASNSRKEVLAGHIKLIGAESLKVTIDRSSAFENARSESWAALRNEHRQRLGALAVEVLVLLSKGAKK